MSLLLTMVLLTCGSQEERPTQHPYLYFTQDTLARLQARIEREPFAGRWQRFLRNAEVRLREKPFGMTNTRQGLGAAGTTAFAYALTGDTRYATRAKQEVFALLSAERWHTPRHWNKGADLQTAEASVACALVYDWCYDTFTGEERAHFQAGVLGKSLRVYLASVDKHRDWWVDNPVSNWAGVCHGGCGLLGLALVHEIPESRQVVAHAQDHLAGFLREVVREDGGGHEGVMYNRYGLKFGHYFLSAMTHCLADDGGLYEETTAKRVGYWDVYMQAPDGLYANFNNMNEHTFQGLYGADSRRTEGGPSSTLAALWESKVPGGDPLLRWAADHGGAAFYWMGASPFYFLWRSDAPPAPAKLPTLADAVLFRGAGHAVLRSSGLWLAYNGGWTSNKSHANMDLGTFVLVADGERLVHDPGYGKAETAEHSTVLIDGQGQPKNVRGRFLRFGSGRGFHYLASDLSACYDRNLRRFVRHILMIGSEYVIILDDLVTASPAQFEWRMQTRHAIAVGDNDATIQGDKTTLQVIAAAPRDVEVDQGQASLRFVRLRNRRPSTQETFVVVLRVADGGAAPPIELSEGKLTIGTHTILFQKTADGWMLQKVNGEDATSIPDGSQQTVVRFGVPK